MFQLIFLLFCIQYELSSATPLLGTHERASRSEFPFVVSIGHADPKSRGVNHICGGSLISEKHVLTTDFCVRDEKVDDLQVLVATNKLHSSSYKYHVAAVTFYDSWAKEHQVESYVYNDIAILTLKEEVTEVGPVSLNAITNSRFYGKIATTAGWGETDKREISKHLQKSDLKVLSPKECSVYLYQQTGKQYRLHERYFCTVSTPPTLLGNGDGGSPLLYNNTIVAVNDGTFPPDVDQSAKKVNIHISVSYYRKFIEDTTKPNN